MRVQRAEQQGGAWNGLPLAQYEVELAEANRVLRELEQLEQDLRATRSLPAELAARALRLGVTDRPPPPVPRGPGKQRAAAAKRPTGPRKPYKSYVSSDGIEIRVGRTAKDNDQLSLDPDCRDSRFGRLNG